MYHYYIKLSAKNQPVTMIFFAELQKFCHHTPAVSENRVFLLETR